MCSFLREAVVSFVSHSSMCVHVSAQCYQSLPPKEPTLQKDGLEGGEKER